MLAVALLIHRSPVSSRIQQRAVAHLEVRRSGAAPLRVLARLAYAIVRGHVESVLALGRVLRSNGGHHPNREEGEW